MQLTIIRIQLSIPVFDIVKQISSIQCKQLRTKQLLWRTRILCLRPLSYSRYLHPGTFDVNTVVSFTKAATQQNKPGQITTEICTHYSVHYWIESLRKIVKNELHYSCPCKHICPCRESAVCFLNLDRSINSIHSLFTSYTS